MNDNMSTMLENHLYCCNVDMIFFSTKGVSFHNSKFLKLIKICKIIGSLSGLLSGNYFE